MFKRIIYLTLITLLSVSLFSCGGSDSGTSLTKSIFFDRDLLFPVRASK
ncbi:MAG: hypothetical protein ACC707_10060 [Thiohalomonadales bacterium]